MRCPSEYCSLENARKNAWDKFGISQKYQLVYGCLFWPHPHQLVEVEIWHTTVTKTPDAPRPCFPGFPKLKTAAPVGFSRPRLRQRPAMHFCDTDGPQWKKLTVTNKGLRGNRSGIAISKNRQPIPKAQEMWVHKSGIEIPSSSHFNPFPPKNL